MQSPYAKHKKSPYKYSGTYQEWKRAVTSGNKPLAESLARDHRRQFGPPLTAQEKRKAA